jgi:hypothetical protein
MHYEGSHAYKNSLRNVVTCTGARERVSPAPHCLISCGNVARRGCYIIATHINYTCPHLNRVLAKALSIHRSIPNINISRSF